MVGKADGSMRCALRHHTLMWLTPPLPVKHVQLFESRRDLVRPDWRGPKPNTLKFLFFIFLVAPSAKKKQKRESLDKRLRRRKAKHGGFPTHLSTT